MKPIALVVCLCFVSYGGRAIAQSDRQLLGAALPKGYSLAILPPLPGGIASQAEAINATGTVVGYSIVDRDGHAHATRWDGATPTDLGLPFGATYAYADAVNRRGEIAGYAANDSGFPVAVLWTSTGIVTLGTLPGYDSSLATGIDADGTVVGVSFVQADTSLQQGFKWTAATGMQPLVGIVSVLAIDSGMVVGIGENLHATCSRMAR
jgi:probable HAF family extracellular repeat protein